MIKKKQLFYSGIDLVIEKFISYEEILCTLILFVLNEFSVFMGKSVCGIFHYVQIPIWFKRVKHFQYRVSSSYKSTKTVI